MLLPICLEIEEKNILVVGGGQSAEIKIRTLLDFQGNITVVAPTATKAVFKFSEQKKIRLIEKKIEEQDLEGMSVVVAAADKATNKAVWEMAQKKHLLCCLCGKGERGDFIFPSHHRQGDLTIAVSTNGKFPKLAKKLAAEFPMQAASCIPYLEQKRREIQEKFTPVCRNIILEALISDEVLNDENFKEKMDAVIERYEINENKNRNERQ